MGNIRHAHSTDLDAIHESYQKEMTVDWAILPCLFVTKQIDLPVGQPGLGCFL